MKVNGQWVPSVRNSFYSFMLIALKLYMCYGHGLKLCMWFGYNPRIIFMPPTSKKLRGHIGLGLSVQSSPVQWCAVCDA